MSAASPVVWIVASVGAAERWAPALASCRLDVHALAWSELQPPAAADVDLAGRLREARDHLTILTSPNAARFVPEAACAGVRAACVGQTSADAARAKGFRVVHVGRAGGEALARELVSAMPDLAEVHVLHQHHARTEGWDVLRAAGVTVRLTCSYVMAERGDFQERVAAAPEPAAVVLGSLRAAEALHAAWARTGREWDPGVWFAALGDITADVARQLLGDRVVVARETNPAALADVIARHLDIDRETT